MSHPTRFMRKPFFVSGYCVTEENMEAIAKWCGGYVIRQSNDPFIHVPVTRATNVKQYEAYVGTWVIVSVLRGERSFKVYTEEWLHKQFMEVTVETFDDPGIPDNFEERTGTTREIPIPRSGPNGSSRPPTAQLIPPKDRKPSIT